MATFIIFILSLLSVSTVFAQSPTTTETIEWTENRHEHFEILGDKWSEKNLLNYKLLDREEVKKNNFGRREDLLRYAPGVNLTNDKNMNGRIEIRGLSNRHLEVIDGARTRFSGGHVYAPLLDPFFLEAIKLNSSATAGSSGSGAIGGQLLQESVNLSGLLNDSSRSFLTQLQSGNNVSFGAGALYAQELSSAWDFGIGYVKRRFEDRKLSDGTRLSYSAMDSESSILKLNYGSDLFQSKTSFIYRKDKSLLPLNPEAEASVFPDSFLSQVDRQQFLLSENIGYKLSTQQLRFHVSLQQQDLIKDRIDISQRDERTATTFQTNLSDEIAWLKNKSHELSTYHQVEHFQTEVQGVRDGNQPILSYPNGKEQETSHHHRLQWSYQKLSTFVGGRNYFYQGTNSSATNQERNYSGWLPEAGLTITLFDKLSSGILYSKAYQNPTLSQLYPEGQHFPGNFYVANNDLLPEQSQNFEWNTKWQGSQLQTGITLYRNKATNFINQEITMTSTRFENIDKVTTQGIEGFAKYNFSKVSTGVNFDFHKHVDESTGDYLNNQAPNRVNWLVDWSILDTWSAGFAARNMLPQMRVSAGLPTPSNYWLFDLHMNFQSKIWQENIFWNLRANNIFNRQYFMPGSSLSGSGAEYFISLGLEV